MQVLGRQFKPGLLFTLLYLLIGGAMLALGSWQLQRAAEKIRMLNASRDSAAQVPVAIEQQEFDTIANYTRVEIAGTFEASRQFLWDNRVLQAQAGFEVVTPLRLADNRLVLINRGWVAPGSSRTDLPDIGFNPTSQVRFTGIVSRPSIGFSSGDAVNLSALNWPALLQHFDFEQIAQSLDTTLDPAASGALYPVLIQVERSDTESTNLNGVPLFRNNWNPVAFGPERHYGYAFQWFAMFVALTFIYFILNSKRIDNTGV